MAQVDTLIILDRAVDLLSTLPTQLTYEGNGRKCNAVFFNLLDPDP